ncbi:hypothetical protein Tco_1331900, partial [Tanacetum coccineum]
PIEIDSIPNVNRNLTPMCHRNLTKEWEQLASSVEGPIIKETSDPLDGLVKILGDYANTKEEITGKQMIVHVGYSSTVENVVDYDMLFDKEGVGPMENFKEVEVDTKNEIEEESNTKENDTSGIDSEDLDYDPKHDEMFDDDDHILFNDTDDGIDLERRDKLRELRRIGKAKNHGPDKYYFYLGQQFATKEIMKGRVMKHSIENRRKLILMGGPWPGQILTAVRVDANNEIYQVAYAIVKAESKRYCVKHIHKNMKLQFKGSVYKDMLWNAARATTIVEFNKIIGQLKSYNSAAYDWLMKFPAE